MSDREWLVLSNKIINQVNELVPRYGSGILAKALVGAAAMFSVSHAFSVRKNVGEDELAEMRMLFDQLLLDAIETYQRQQHIPDSIADMMVKARIALSPNDVERTLAILALLPPNSRLIKVAPSSLKRSGAILLDVEIEIPEGIDANSIKSKIAQVANQMVQHLLGPADRDIVGKVVSRVGKCRVQQGGKLVLDFEVQPT